MVEDSGSQAARKAEQVLENPAIKTPDATISVMERCPTRAPKDVDSYISGEKGIPIGARSGKAKLGLPGKTLSEKGWPDLPGRAAKNFNNAEPVTYKSGRKIYRIVDDNADHAGEYWLDKLPASGAEWRSGAAVKPNWNKNGYYIEYTVPEGTELKVWRGEAAAQQLGPDHYLPGGAQQIWMPRETIVPGPAKLTGW